MKPGIAGMTQGSLLLAMLLLTAQGNAQDDVEADADFLDMLEFIGEFSGENGEWTTLESELESTVTGDAAEQESGENEAQDSTTHVATEAL